MNVFDILREKIENNKTCKGKLEGYIPKHMAISIVNQVENEHNNGWIPCEERLPEVSEELLLVQCNGQYRNIRLHNALCFALYTEDGWKLEMFPEWDRAEVVAWQELPEEYQPKKEE